MVVRVDRLLRAALAPSQLDGAVADDLVGVHVGLGARTGLEDDQWELVIELSGDDFVSGLDDEVGDVARQLTQFLVGQCRGLLEGSESTDHVSAPDEGVTTDLEVVKGALCLGAPVMLGGYFDLAHAVFLNAHLCHVASLLCRWVTGLGGVL